MAAAASNQFLGMQDMPARLSTAEARALGLIDAPAASKYRARPTVYNGVRYASKAEAARRAALDADPAVRLVVDQPVFRLGCPENVYRADFLVVYHQPRPGISCGVVVEDVKGHATAKFRRDVKLWRSYGRVPLWIITNGRVVEIVEPNDREGVL